MPRIDFTVPSSDGVHELAACHWVCENTKAVVLIVHGIKEYMGRYERLAGGLTQRGLAVYGYEQLGHGRTAKPGGLGYIAKKGGHTLLVEDVRVMAAEVRKRSPGLPLILFGHSMGSMVVRAFLAMYGAEVDGAVLTGTLGPDPMARINIIVCRMIAAVRGTTYRSALIENLAFGKFNRRIDTPRTQSDWLTRDTAIVDQFIGDPLFAYRFTAGGYGDAARLLLGVSSSKWAKKIPTGLPLLVTTGDMDPCGGYGKGVDTVVQWMRKAGHTNVTYKVYPGARHELHNETGREAYYDDVASWVHSIHRVERVP
jgi:alpha-beta hydrolase superfamily lysophospholipase